MTPAAEQIPACGFTEPHFAHRVPDLNAEIKEDGHLTLLPCPGRGTVEQIRAFYSCPD